jgi:hypothetical protein
MIDIAAERVKAGKRKARGNGSSFQHDSGAPVFDPWERFIVPEFPLHVLPPVVQKYVTSQSVVIGCDHAALAMAALTAISGALDHRFAVKMMRNGNWWEHPAIVDAPGRRSLAQENADHQRCNDTA